VDRSRQLDLPFDALDSAAAYGNPRRHPRREPEAVVAEVQHLEAVDLADATPLGLDANRALSEELLQALFDEVGATGRPPTLSPETGPDPIGGGRSTLSEGAAGEQPEDMQIRTLVSPNVVKAEVTEPWLRSPAGCGRTGSALFPCTRATA
jgi:hypothetical protein